MNAPTIFQMGDALGLKELNGAHFLTILVRMLVAAFLAGVVAYRPWRRFIHGAEPQPRAETAQAQTLIAVAGVVMVVVIGDSTARAFGLVGLGAFIRFRAGIKDPRDAAVMFVMIGIGMACGLGLLPLAAVTTSFAIFILVLFDATGRARPRRRRVGIELDEPRLAWATVRGAFPAARILEAPNDGPDRGRVVLEIDAHEDVDAASLLETLRARGIVGVRHVTIDDE